MLQRVQIVAHLRTDARLFHIARGVGVLGVDERLRLRAVGVLKPAVVVHDLGSEIIVRHRNGLRIRRRRQSDSAASVNRLGKPRAPQQKRRPESRKMPQEVFHGNRIRVPMAIRSHNGRIPVKSTPVTSTPENRNPLQQTFVDGVETQP